MNACILRGTNRYLEPNRLHDWSGDSCSYKSCQWKALQNAANVLGMQSSLLRTVEVAATVCRSVLAVAETAASLGKSFPGKQKTTTHKKATMPTLWGLIPMSHHMLKLVLLLWHEATQLNGGVCTETLFNI